MNYKLLFPIPLSQKRSKTLFTVGKHEFDIFIFELNIQIKTCINSRQLYKLTLFLHEHKNGSLIKRVEEHSLQIQA